MILRYPTSLWLKDDDIDLHKKLWQEDLKTFSDESVRAAMGSMIDAHPVFAPVIGEFKKLVASSRVRPAGLAIELAPICPSCRSLRNSQHHQDTCGEVK